MRTPTLLLSVAVHGFAIGVAVMLGALRVEAEVIRPRVELVATAGTAAAAPNAIERPEPLSVTREPSAALPALTWDPPLPIEALGAPVFVPADEPVSAPDPVAATALLERVVPRPAQPVVEPPPVSATEASAPKPQLPEPAEARAFVAASPRADNQPPDYPARERASGVEGDVVVGARVDRHGVVLEVWLAQPSRHAGFNRAALAAVRRWRFEPAQRDGAAMEDEVSVAIEFRIVSSG